MARLEVITGPMFSGKSEELARRLRRAVFAEKTMLLVRPDIDNRKTRNIFDLISKDQRLSDYHRLQMARVDSGRKLQIELTHFHTEILAIDEAQFLTFEFLDLILDLLETEKNNDFTIMVSGLNMDADARPFGIMPDLMARADEILLLTAICTECRNAQASFTQKIGGSGKQIEIGDENIYTARCRKCFVKASKLPLI
ncbi:MAG: thymidine kinase [Candidatus Yanofskybacteria bacterium]|nr:thymidine kinase [Candidatus Yanofskybacteria bacterium]